MPSRSASVPVSERGSGRAAWGSISREQIIDAGLRALRGPGGYEAMTIRGLAADLGVAPMSLYRHVRDKDDLLDEIVDRLLVRAWRPRTTSADWKDWIVEAADKLRHFLVSQPAALHIYLQHPVTSPTAITRMEAIMDVLRGAVGDEQAARRAYAAIHTYTIGFAALEASRAGWDATRPEPEPPPQNQSTSDPATRQMAEQLAVYTTPRQFTEGLRYLIEGIAHHAT